MQYIKQFDAIRAIAVLLVIFAHWLPKDFDTILPLGTIGVDIFFVLSGFLITRILLTKKYNIENSIDNDSKLVAIKKFIIRRSLRIFPIYYLVIFLLIIGVGFLPNPVPKDWIYYVTYTQNILTFIRGVHPGGKVGHLWSLAVEEQFYFFWPWFIFYINAKRIKSLLISSIVIGCLFSLILPFIFPNNGVIQVLMPASLQALCMGGILAYIHLNNERYLNINYRVVRYLGFISILIYVLLKFSKSNIVHFDLILVSLFSFWIFTIILLNKGNKLFNIILNNSKLLFLGKISYGIYIYHYFIPTILKAILHLFKKQFEVNSYLYEITFILQSNQLFIFISSFISLILLSHLSFKYFERYFLTLKNRYN